MVDICDLKQNGLLRNEKDRFELVFHLFTNGKYPN